MDTGNCEFKVGDMVRTTSGSELSGVVEYVPRKPGEMVAVVGDCGERFFCSASLLAPAPEWVPATSTEQLWVGRAVRHEPGPDGNAKQGDGRVSAGTREHVSVTWERSGLMWVFPTGAYKLEHLFIRPQDERPTEKKAEDLCVVCGEHPRMVNGRCGECHRLARSRGMPELGPAPPAPPAPPGPCCKRQAKGIAGHSLGCALRSQIVRREHFDGGIVPGSAPMHMNMEARQREHGIKDPGRLPRPRVHALDVELEDLLADDAGRWPR